MGKTIGRLALVAAAVAVNFIPGVGQAISATLVSAGVSAGAAAAISAAVISTITISGITAAGGLLGLGPKAPPAQSTVTTVKSPTPPRVYGYGRRRLYGSKILFETASDGSTVDVYAFADGEADGVEQVYLNDDKVTLSGDTVNTLPDKRYQSGLVRAGFNLGLATGAAFAAVIAKLPGIWTSNHRGDGVVTGYLIKNPEKEKYLLDTYPQGDNVELSAVFRLRKCFDPRNGLTAWTENPVLHLLDYLIEQRGYDYATRIAPTEQYWIDAANVCDESVPLKAGGSEPRYRSCVTYDATRPPKEIMAAILETFDGWIAPRGDGALVIYAGNLYEPTVTLGPDQIINYNLPYGVASENRIDQFNVSYVSAPHDYNVVDTTPWGEPGIRSEPFSPQSSSHSQNRRLAKRAYARANEFNRGSITTNLGGRVARGERYVNLRIEESGIVFFDGIAEIVAVKRDFEAGGLAIEWIAIDENIDAWNPATEEGEPAALGDNAPPFALDVPVIEVASTFYDTVSDGGTGARVRIVVDTPAPRADYTWFARWRRPTDSAWNEQQYTDVGGGASVTLETGFVPALAGLEVQVLYTAGSGQSSDWSATAVVDARTDITPPDDAVSITLTNWSDTLDLVSDSIPRASSYRWRFYAPDGTTLIRTIVTGSRTVSYTAQQAAVDGARRDYIVRVAGVNGAGAGGEASTGVITLPAPPAVMGVTAAEDTPGNAVVNFTQQSGVAGYSIATSTVANFDPLTQGFIVRALGSPAYIQNLAVATYYTKVAAFDGWTDRPDLLNYSAEATFTITATSGGSGGSGGGGGGGYCVTEDTPILMANGDNKRAGDIAVGDHVWTQHEHTMQWDTFEVTHAETVDSDDVWFAQLGPSGLKATGNHRIWLSGAWVMMRNIGVPCDPARVVRLTVDEAHTYVSGGILSHNIKPSTPEP